MVVHVSCTIVVAYKMYNALLWATIDITLRVSGGGTCMIVSNSVCAVYLQ